MNINDIINDSNFIILIGGILLALLVLSVVTIILIIQNIGMKKKYKIFMSGFYEGKNFEDMLDTIVNQIDYLENKTNEQGKRLAAAENNLKFSIQKTSLIRYNAFQNKGGDQSFSVALLDSKDNGFVITSIYNDGVSSVYGKDIKAGLSEHRLSEEEINALDTAKKFSSENIVKQ
jgi:hypothetical protein